MVKFETVIKGISSLIQSNCQCMGTQPPKSPEQIPAWLELQVYKGEDGCLYHPAAAVRNCFLEGARSYKIGKKSAATILRGIVSLYPEMSLPIYVNGEQAKEYKCLTTSAVNRASNPPARIITYRPYVEGWEMRFITEVNDEFLDINQTSIKQLKDIWKQSGMMVGIGCWRPEKKGLYGRYELKKFEQI